ncbi:MAG: hypothetical protein AAGE52_02920 [Myxococcota bacterium]
MKKLLALVLALVAVPAMAQSPEECAPTDSVDHLRLLRQASLDIRNRVPSYDEIEEVRAATDREAVVTSMIGGMFEEEEYFDQVRRTFQVQLWSSLDAVDLLIAGANRLRYDRPNDLWWQNNSTRRYRGDAGRGCLNQPQTEFDADGRPVPIQQIREADCQDVGFGDGVCVQEGYVMVSPFWDPSTQIKVCAFDAQDAAVGIAGQACDVYNASDRGCGCGPNLNRCMREGADTDDIRAALEEEPARIFEWVVREDRSIIEAFTTRTSFVNGRSTHMYRHMDGSANVTAGGPIVFEPQMPTLPPIPYTNAEWQQIERGPDHAGVLTTMAYLLRFASNRARANRFYTAFLCDPFVPSADGLPPEEAEPHPDLRQRNGCEDCHNVLEPAAAHWGRWRTGGTFGFFGQGEFSFLEPVGACLCGPGTDRNNCNNYCQTYHVTAANSHPDTYAEYGGLPLSAIYLEEGEDTALDDGPRALVDEESEQHQVAECTVRTLAQSLLGRELSTNELVWLETQTDSFEADGMRYTGLFERLVMDPKYRALR